MHAADIPAGTDTQILLQSISSSALAHTVASIEGDRPLTYINEAFSRITGYTSEDALGQNCRFLQGEDTDLESINKIRLALNSQTPIQIEMLNYTKFEQPFWNFLRLSPVFDEHGKAIAFIGEQADITEEHYRRESDLQRQRMEALGRIAANISHEIKNALLPLNLIGDSLKGWETMPRDQLAQHINMMSQGIISATEIAKTVLDYARPAQVDPIDYDTSSLGKEIGLFAKNLTPSRFNLHLDINPHDFGHVKLNKNQLLQILTNVFNNATHALGPCGDIRLKWTHTSSPGMFSNTLSIPRGRYLVIEVADSGSGMTRDIRERAFDPFFTTKPHSEGTGLGLSISNQIVQEWGGHMTLQSHHGKGTQVSIYLPLYGQQPSS